MGNSSDRTLNNDRRRKGPFTVFWLVTTTLSLKTGVTPFDTTKGLLSTSLRTFVKYLPFTSPFISPFCHVSDILYRRYLVFGLNESKSQSLLSSSG